MVSTKNPVARHGHLQVSGRDLIGEHKQVVQLRGVSSHGLHWFPRFINPQSLAHLRDDWAVSVVRLAMYLDEGGFAKDSAIAETVEHGVQLAIDAGLYVVVDWHVHHQDNIERSGDPRKYQSEAIEFFRRISLRFGSCPNLIYEIANEPKDVTWEEICAYAVEVIAAIRSEGSRNLIVVGTPNWSQDVEAAERSRLTDVNLAYALHFYAGTHEHLLPRARAAVDAGLPLFVSEWGTTESSGNGGVHVESSAEWMRFLREKKISWINWSLCDKREDSALLRHGAAATGPWPTEQLTDSGIFVRGLLLGLNDI